MAQCQMQIQLQPTQQIEAQLLMTQIDSLFNTFESAIKYKYSGNANQDGMVAFNDAAVSLLGLFGAQCDKYKKEKEADILRASYAYFLQKKSKQLTSLKQQDVTAINSWLVYMEAALASKKRSKQLKISQQTVEFAEQNMMGRMAGVMGKILGQNHEAQHIAKDVERNAVRYQRRNDEWRKQTKSQYDASQQTAQCPAEQDAYYQYTGNTKLRYKTPSEEFGKGAVNLAEMDVDGKEEEEEEEEQQEGAATPKKREQPGSAMQAPYNAMAKNGPKQLSTQCGVVNMSYPVPCRVLQVVNKECVMVQFAAPYSYITAQWKSKHIERDPEQVQAFERAYLHHNKLQHLGYDQ